MVLALVLALVMNAGAMTQDALQRTAGAVGMADAQRRATVPETPMVHTDDTGWRVGGEPVHLIVFETDMAIVYQIRPRHRHEAVQEVIPADYAGVMVTDRGRSYDARAFDRVEQQKCLAHILRSLSDVVERKTGRALECGTRLKTVL